MAGQLYFLWGGTTPAWVVGLLVGTGHPLRWIYIVLALLIFPTVAIPAIWLLRSDKALQGSAALFERLSLLSGLYLSLDLVALAITVIRNV
jgi:hypothetical protein